jgi:hypothetical protein
MLNPRLKAAAILFAAATVSYFIAESVLRQAALSKLASSRIGVEAIVARLPQGFRQRVRDRIEYGRLRDAVIQAKTPSAKAMAMISLAMIEKSADAAKLLYRQVLHDYPSLPESAQAYQYFLLDEGEGGVSIPQYHAFVTGCPAEARLSIWSMGIAELERRQVPPETQQAFLRPLLEISPDCFEYQSLYKKMAALADLAGDSGAYEAAAAMMARCEDLPLLQELMLEREKKLVDDKASDKAEAEDEGDNEADAEGADEGEDEDDDEAAVEGDNEDDNEEADAADIEADNADAAEEKTP